MAKKLLTILLAMAPSFAMAQDMAHTHLHEIVVSGNRWCHESETQPTKISIIPFEKSNAYNPQTAADMLALSGNVFIQKSQYGGGSPMIRGFATNRLLYSVDGVRMNSAIYRSGNIQNVISLDPFAIASTEVLFGPGSVSYGSDAIGGVMVFNTLKPKFATGENPLLYGSATLRTATASQELTGHLHVGVGFKKWGFITSYTASSFDDLKQGTNGPDDYIMPYIVQPQYAADGTIDDRVLVNTDERKQAPSGYSQQNFMQKISYAPSKQWTLEYAFHLSRTSEYARYDRHQRMKNGKPRYAEWNYGPQKWMMNHLRVQHSGNALLYDSMKIDAAVQRFEESRISRNLNNPKRETQSEKVDAWSINTDVSKSLSENLFLYYGWEYVLNKVNSVGESLHVVTGAAEPMAARYPKAHWHSMGVYMQTEWHPTARLNIMAGVRYNYYRIKSDFSKAGYDVPFAPLQKNNASSVSGNIGLNWRSSSGWLLRANYARGFRAPNVDDMGKLFDSVDGCVTVPNPNLEPEYADNIEIGVAKHIGDFLKFDVTAYYTRLDNAIVRRDYTFNGVPTMEYNGDVCRVQALQNAAVANVWGVQASVDARFCNFFYVKSNVNFQRGREELDNGDKSPSRHAAPLFGRVAVGFDNTRLRVEAYTVFQDECKADDMPWEEKEKTEIYALDGNGKAYSPSWATLNLNISYAIMDNLHLNSTFENITDKRYRPYSSGISAPGRNMTMGITYNF